MDNEYKCRGLYYEDYKTGMRYISMGKTIVEADVAAFSGLTGDFSSIHTDAVYAAGFHFGKRVVHGLLGLSTAVGLAVRIGLLEGTVLAFREILNWKFSAPIFINDTIHVVLEVVELKAVPRLGGGLVTLRAEVCNQENKIVQQGNWSVLIKSSTV
jgi:3-hydroxybutyryl-CoA dehydratase